MVGSSLAVHSAFRHVRAACKQGTPVAILNVGETRAEVEGLNVLKIEAPAGPTLERPSLAEVPCDPCSCWLLLASRSPAKIVQQVVVLTHTKLRQARGHQRVGSHQLLLLFFFTQMRRMVSCSELMLPC